MRILRSLLLVVLCTLVLLVGLGLSVQAHQRSFSPARTSAQPGIVRVAQTASDPSDVQIKPFLRIISIPFGFAPPLLLNDTGQSIHVTGQGGCTAGEAVTVIVTLTQTSTTAVATGQTQETCSGERQTWGTRATTTGNIPFTTAPAEACGLAITMDGDTETDHIEWCRSIDFFHGKFLPYIVNTE